VNGGKVSDATRQKITNVLREKLWDDVPVEMILRYGDVELLWPTEEAAKAAENRFPLRTVRRDGRVIQITPGTSFRLSLCTRLPIANVHE